ncbi:MAG: hypothetical protein JXB49_13360 [Bacteroidales bacterium]|nr:hypothetical protein [Bacteroidales bacterium]
MKRVVGTLTLLFFFVLYVLGQPGPNPAPVDGGLGILIAAGLFFGVSRLRKKRNEL